MAYSLNEVSGKHIHTDTTVPPLLPPHPHAFKQSIVHAIGARRQNETCPLICVIRRKNTAIPHMGGHVHGWTLGQSHIYLHLCAPFPTFYLLFIFTYLLTFLFNLAIQQNIYYNVKIIVVIKFFHKGIFSIPGFSALSQKLILNYCNSSVFVGSLLPATFLTPELNRLKSACITGKGLHMDMPKYRAMEQQPKQHHEALVRGARQAWHCSCLMDLLVPGILVSSGIIITIRDISRLGSTHSVGAREQSASYWKSETGELWCCQPTAPLLQRYHKEPILHRF